MAPDDELRGHLKAILSAARIGRNTPSALAAIKRRAEAALILLGPQPRSSVMMLEYQITEMQAEIQRIRVRLMESALRKLVPPEE